LEPKEKEENHRGANTPKHLQLAIQVKKEWTVSWLDQFTILYKRTYRARFKEYFDILRLVQALGIALLLGLLWWKSSTNTEAQLRDQVLLGSFRDGSEHFKSWRGQFTYKFIAYISFLKNINMHHNCSKQF
jgi:hypothetical protein